MISGLVRLEQSESICRTGLEQSQLRSRFVENTPAFVSDLHSLRTEADQAICAQLDGRANSHRRAEYPIGFCKPIRDYALARMLDEHAAHQHQPALMEIAAFRAAGGTVKGVWGVQKGIYFQNAIQIGDLWCDLANDTVDRHRAAVEVCPMPEALFEELTSFEQFAEVAACYWGQTAYPNHLFPAISAVLPVILVDAGNRMRLAAPKTLVPRNIRLTYTLAERFLGDGKYASRQLPPALMRRLERAFLDRSGWFSRVPAWCTRFDPSLGPSDSERLIDIEKNLCCGLDERAFMRRFFEIIRCTVGEIDVPGD